MRFAMPTTEFLSVADQADLIAAAQEAPVTFVLDEAGDERTVYGKTAASESALERLTLAFMPVIEKEARRSKVGDPDDVLGTVLAEFVATVRRHDTTSPIPFSKTIGTILGRCVSDTARTSDLVQIKESAAAYYWRLIHKHDGDFSAAYAEVKESGTGLAPATFLSIHSVIGGIDSIDPLISAEDSSGPRHALATALEGPEGYVVDRAMVAHLFTLVGEQERTILRLAYGFRDHATETLRLAAGFKIGEALTDLEVAACGIGAGIGRATVNRRRLAALAVMREAALASFEE